MSVKKQVAKRLVRKFVEVKIRLLYQDSERDKYRFELEAGVDCQNRQYQCKAVFCKFPFALSRQDIEESVIGLEFGRIYLIAHGANGYCVHLVREIYRCTVWEQQPVFCWGFDCETVRIIRNVRYGRIMGRRLLMMD